MDNALNFCFSLLLLHFLRSLTCAQAFDEMAIGVWELNLQSNAVKW